MANVRNEPNLERQKYLEANLFLVYLALKFGSTCQLDFTLNTSIAFSLNKHQPIITTQADPTHSCTTLLCGAALSTPFCLLPISQSCTHSVDASVFTFSQFLATIRMLIKNLALAIKAARVRFAHAHVRVAICTALPCSLFLLFLVDFLLHFVLQRRWNNS